MTRAWVSTPALVAGAQTIDQGQLALRMDAALAECGAPSRLRQQAVFVHQRAGVARRHFELPLDESAQRRDWFRATNEASERLARRALEALEPSVLRSCDGLICVSSSHAGFPSLSRVLQDGFGLDRSMVCFDLAGLGCAGPTHGLFLADTLVGQGVCDAVCVLCVDVMGTQSLLRRHFAVPTLAQVVAHCLASDAAGAVVVRREPWPGAALDYDGAALRSELWPDSLDQNDLNACEHNEPFLAVGKAIRTRLTQEVEPLLEALGESRFLLHPGGKALMTALGAARPDLGDSIAIASDVLENHGNVGAASLIWVLGRALERRAALTSRLTLFALGPGIVTTALTLDGVGVSAEAAA